MKQNISSAIQKPARDAVVAGKHGAPLISDRKLLDLHAALLRATGQPAPKSSPAPGTAKAPTPAANVKFPAVYASLLADLTPHDRITADIPIQLTPFNLGSPLQGSPELATGLALGLADHKPRSLVIAFTRANHLHPDSFRHTLRAAAQNHAPILYVLLPPPPAAASLNWSEHAILENVPCIPVDAHDAVALYRVAQETILRARNHGGPSLIDCKQVQLARGDSNPVARLEAHLHRKALVPAAKKHASAKSTSSSPRLA
jgi:hypothetical protein